LCSPADNEDKVVAEFLNVFEDVTGLPLEGDTEFSITMLLGSGLTSKAPYIMVPTEIIKLKK